MADEPGIDKYAEWYESLNELEQGALLTNVLVFEETDPPLEGEISPASGDDEGTDVDTPFVSAREANVIVLTQSCDIRKPAQQRILVAEVQGYREITAEGGDRSNSYRRSAYREDLISGTAIAEFVIPPSSLLSLEWSIVNFREIYIIDRDRLRKNTDLVGLASPYREHLGQAFARFMMRVGLPQPLHEFKDFKPWSES